MVYTIIWGTFLYLVSAFFLTLNMRRWRINRIAFKREKDNVTLYTIIMMVSLLLLAPLSLVAGTGIRLLSNVGIERIPAEFYWWTGSILGIALVLIAIFAIIRHTLKTDVEK